MSLKTKLDVVEEQTAAGQYKSRMKDIKKILVKIDKALNKHEKDFKKSLGGEDWGYSGSLGHVYAELVDILSFLTRK